MIRAFFKILFCGPLLCLCRPFCIFERGLDSNPESCHSKQAGYGTIIQEPPISLSFIFSLNHITSFPGVYTLLRWKLWSRVRIMSRRICLARASQLRPGSRWPSRCSRSHQPLWRLEHRYIYKDLFGESQPAAVRKPVAKSLFKEPSAPLEARAQVYVAHWTLF